MKNENRKFSCGTASLLAGAVLLTGAARAATLDATTVIGSVTKAAIPLQGGTQNVSINTNAPAGYYWGDRLTNGNNDAVTPPGLDMGAYSLTTPFNTGNSEIMLLDLNGGSITATSGSISSAGTNYSGSISIFNVGDISLGDGGFSTLNTRLATQTRSAGLLQIGTNNAQAGNIQAASVICGRLGAGTRGSITLYGSGSVMITNQAGQAGPFIIYGSAPSAGSGAMDVKVFHRGSFKAGLSGIDKFFSSGSTDKHQLLFNGWFGGSGSPSGGFSATQIVSRAENSHTSNARGVPAADLSVVNYASVSVAPGGIETYTAHTAASVRNFGTAGNITITNILNDIEINGVVDAHSDDTDNPVGTRGILNLQAGGDITINSLNLSNVQYAAFSPGGNAYMQGELANFVAAGAGAGTDADPVLTTQTALRVTTNKVVYYVAGANTGLAQKVYRIASPTGTAQAGGLLKPISQTTTGTTIFIR